jgi:Protein of unknown function (DUF3108)
MEAGMALVTRRALRLFALISLAAFAPASGQAAPPPLPGPLHFVAHWQVIPAGAATMAWSRAGGQIKISFTADSNDLVSLFYPVHDRMATAYAPASYCAARADNHVVEGRRQRHTVIQYEPRRKRLVLDESDPSRPAAPAKHAVTPLPGCVLDLFSALDYIRAQPLHLGDVYEFPVNEGGKTAEVHLAIDLKATITTPAGTFTAVRATPTILGRAGPRPGRLWVWFSDDARHLPVEIQGKVSWGTITAQLSP